MKPTRSHRALIKLEQEVHRQDWQRSLEQPGPCELHPAWRPNTVGRPAPPVSMCPHCRAEAEGNRPETPEKQVVHLTDLGATATPSGWRAAQRVFEKRPELLGIPTRDEEDALAAIDLAREAELADLQPKRRRGILAGARIENGEWVEYRATPGRGIVRVVG